jgi:hypothetical protein
MKTIFTCSLLMAGIMIFQTATAQESCQVLMASISGKYEGDCKKGKANGKGKAEGTDQYVGEFKDGLPHGKGLYRWKNGDFYEGSWVNGKKDGQGGMSHKRSGQADSVTTGYWKKDAYIGKNEKPYIIHNRTNHFSMIEIKKNKSGLENNITIELGSTSGGAKSITRGSIPKPELTDIRIRKGSFLQSQSMNQGERISSRTLVKVTFPFHAIYYVGNQETEIEILEPGNWRIILRLNE